MPYRIIFLFLLFIVSDIQAQNWKRTRYELSGGIGIASFMGDIGAPKNEGINKYVWMHYQAFSPIGHAGMRYIINQRLSVKSQLRLGILRDSDRFGAYRLIIVGGKTYGRGYYFQTFLAEFSVQGEFHLVRERRKRTLYSQSSDFFIRFRNFNLPTYLFGGLGVNYFNPKMRVGGQWEKMQEIRVKGTGIPKHKMAAVFYGGIGFKYKVTPRLFFGVEAASHICLSDNLDDLGNKVSKYKGVKMAGLGGDFYDIYNTLTFNLTLKMKTNRKGLPRFKRTFTGIF